MYLCLLCKATNYSEKQIYQRTREKKGEKKIVEKSKRGEKDGGLNKRRWLMLISRLKLNKTMSLSYFISTVMIGICLPKNDRAGRCVSVICSAESFFYFSYDSTEGLKLHIPSMADCIENEQPSVSNNKHFQCWNCQLAPRSLSQYQAGLTPYPLSILLGLYLFHYSNKY